MSSTAPSGGAPVAAAPTLELEPVLSLSPAECSEMALDAFGRILDAEASVARSGAAHMRVRLLARLAALEGEAADKARAQLLDHVTQSVGQSPFAAGDATPRHAH